MPQPEGMKFISFKLGKRVSITDVMWKALSEIEMSPVSIYHIKLSFQFTFWKKCTLGPIHSSSVWQNKTLTLTQTLTLIHRAIEAHVGPKVHFILHFTRLMNRNQTRCYSA